MYDITGAAVQELVSAAPSDLVAQLRTAAKRRPSWPFALGVLLLCGLLLGRWGLLLVALGIPAIIWLALRDKAARSVVVVYDVNDEAATRFAAIVNAMGMLSQVGALRQVIQVGAIETTYQYKVNAGASSLISNQPATIHMKGPGVLVTNVAVPTLATGSRAVHFLPDRILISEGKEFADIPYQQVRITTQPIRIIEDGPLPPDAHIVDTTWQYVNVSGGPDRRFKNNRQLPVLLWGRLTLTGPQGLHMVWDASQSRPLDIVAAALTSAASARPPVVQP
ncbi:hypothetical protein AB0K60_21635 [Thermopolyspora sp. NPDC052614]|uniref:hypothetical protein n=1 Tax=Thermopolyspora sp. NPDC052614 TaxID=3155682 RepID=UPI003435465F